METRTVIVTGGGTGIGRGIAAAFAQQGDHVVIMGRTADKLEATAQELGPQVVPQQVDVSQRKQVEQAVAAVVQRFGQVHVLVNNAGFVRSISPDTPLAEAEAAWDEEVDTNLKGAFLMSVAVAPHLARPGGRIINISSIAAYTGGSRGGVLGYSASKAGLHGLTCGLARDLSAQGITANTIAPGLIVETDFFGGQQLSGEQLHSRLEQIPAGRAGRPDDIAAAVVFLASEQASYITGEVLHVNGGWLFGH